MPSPREPTATNEEPHSAPTGTSLTEQEQWFGANLKRLREEKEISQTSFAQRMAEKGFAFHQTTVSRIEAGERPVRLSEATALAELVNATVGYLTRPPDTARVTARLEKAMSSVNNPLLGIVQNARIVTASRPHLRYWIEQARHANVQGWVIETAEQVLNDEPEEAARRGREQGEDIHHRIYEEGAEGNEDSEIVELRLKTYRDVAQITRYVQRGCTVRLDVGDMKDREAKRAVDFIAGLVSGTQGSIERINQRAFLLSPRGPGLTDA